MHYNENLLSFLQCICVYATFYAVYTYLPAGNLDFRSMLKIGEIRYLEVE